jgi:4-hydroxybenzoate polyprenyltransferase
MYAMVDRDDDLKIGVKSSAILFGKYDRLIIGLLQVFLLLVFSVAGVLFEMGAIYFLGVGIVALLVLYHQWLIRSRDRNSCFKAFLHNHWLGAAIFFGIILDYIN